MAIRRPRRKTLPRLQKPDPSTKNANIAISSIIADNGFIYGLGEKGKVYLWNATGTGYWTLFVY